MKKLGDVIGGLEDAAGVSRARVCAPSRARALSTSTSTSTNNINLKSTSTGTSTSTSTRVGGVGGEGTSTCTSTSTFFWMDFVRRSQSVAVQRAVQAWQVSDGEKDEMCRVWEVVVAADVDEAGAREVAPMSELEMLARAELEQGVPYWFVRWWYCDMAKKGWRTSGGIEVTLRNWASLLKRWWSHTREDVLARMQRQYSVAVQGQLGVRKSAAEEADETDAALIAKLPRRPRMTAHHWYECQRTCKKFQDGRCTCGYRVPAVLFAATFGMTQRCAQFEPVPSEWQNEWVLDAEVWEPHVRIDQWGRPCNFAGFKTTEKGQRVKAYFDAHPEEFAEAKFRNDANEPTEEEGQDVDRYLEEVLAWNKLSKEEREKVLEAARKAGLIV